MNLIALGTHTLLHLYQMRKQDRWWLAKVPIVPPYEQGALIWKRPAHYEGNIARVAFATFVQNVEACLKRLFKYHGHAVACGVESRESLKCQQPRPGQI